MDSALRDFFDTVRCGLEQIDDPRRRQGRRYSLTSLLLLLVVGFLSGKKDIKHILEASRHNHRLLAALGLSRVPAAGTYTNLFKQLPIAPINEALRSTGLALGWKSGQTAIDGKSIKGSFNDGLHLHTVNVATEYGIPLAQCLSAPAGGEIVAARDLLAALDVSGQVVTGDAMFAQRDLCETIKKKRPLAVQTERQPAGSA